MDDKPLSAHISPLNAPLVARWADALKLEGSIYGMMDPSGRRALAAGTLQIFQHALTHGQLPAPQILRFVEPPPYREQSPVEFAHATLAVYGMLHGYFHAMEADEEERAALLTRLGLLFAEAVSGVLSARFNRQRKPSTLALDECARILQRGGEPHIVFGALSKRMATELDVSFCAIFGLSGFELEHLGSNLNREGPPPRLSLPEEALTALLEVEGLETLRQIDEPPFSWLQGQGYHEVKLWPLRVASEVVGFILIGDRRPLTPPQSLEARLRELTPLLAPHIQLQQTAAALRRAEATIDDLFDASPNMMCAVDRLGRVLRTNHRFRAEIGVKEGVGGMPFSWLVHPAWVQRFQRLWAQIVIGEVEGQFRVDLITAHSTRLPLSLEARWLKDEHHPPSTCMLALWNVSDQLAREEEDQRRIEDLTAFAHQIAHDLKAPLRTIASFTDLLLEDLPEGISEEVREHAERIEQATEKSAELIGGLLAFAQATESHEDHTPVSLRALLEDATIQLKAEIQAVDAEIHISHDDGPLLGQRVALSALLTNLISNALRYCDGPRPKVEIRVEATVEGWALLSVRDWGVGIAVEDQDKIFQLFKRARVDRPGTGVGLAIVERIAKAHGGAVSVYSELGVGSTFEVRLPTP
ncbi:HAMP domain-containing histidine kinase [Myxococcota bacterium]|nr:HAMP domain-containing histidine kinase [Myxococcota bacterium]